MSHTLTLSDELYRQLEVEAQNRGFGSVEKLLAEIGSTEELRQERRETVRRIDSLREQLRKEYGELPDSTELLRVDRLR